MSFVYKFSKILSLREKEKDEAATVYFESVRKFEQVAEELYKKLKKKEAIEAFQAGQLAKGLSVQAIQHHQKFIANLDQSIDYYQQMVIHARNQMEFHRERLLEKNVEVKKYEKIKQHDYSKFLLAEKQQESKQLDEVSIQQFVNRSN